MFETIALVAPTVEPVTLAEAKAQLRLDADFTLDDAEIGEMIAAARDRAEKFCNRFFTEQQAKIVFYGSIGAAIKLPYPDLASVDAVTYVDSTGAEVAIDGADYVTNLDLGLLFPVTSFPSYSVAYTVTVTTSAPVVHDSVKAAILMDIADSYENRSGQVVGSPINENMAYKKKLYPYRVTLGV